MMDGILAEGLMAILSSVTARNQIEIPSRAQLRFLSKNLTPSDLVELDLDEFGNVDRGDLYQSMLECEGDTRDKLWTLAMEDCFQLPNYTSTQTFKPFSRLPSELRDQIWKHALEDDRVVEIIYDRRRARWWSAKSSQTRAPSVLLACKQSYAIAKGLILKCFGTFMNIETDVYWFNSAKAIDWPAHFENLMIDIYAAWGRDDDHSDEEMENRACANIKKMMVTWDLWDAALNHSEGDMIYGSSGQFNNTFIHLKELVLVHINYVRDRRGYLYRDCRQLRLVDLEESQDVEVPEGEETTISEEVNVEEDSGLEEEEDGMDMGFPEDAFSEDEMPSKQEVISKAKESMGCRAEDMIFEVKMLQIGDNGYRSL
jgi:hypothetical protein